MNFQPPRPVAPKHVPAKLAAALIQQSTARRNTYADMYAKLQRALIDMQSECQTLAAMSRYDEATINALTLGQNSVLQAVALVAKSLQDATQAELVVQGEIQRWLMGFPPSMVAAPPPPPPAAPKAAGPEPAPVVHHPTQTAPVGQQPSAPIPAVQTFESPAAAAQAAEAQAVAVQSNGTAVAAPAIPPVQSS